MELDHPPERPMPAAGSIPWTPGHTTAAALAEAATCPIFFTEATLAAVHAHAAARRRAGACALGLLGGGLFHCPDTGLNYVLVESSVPLSQPFSGDLTKPAIQAALKREGEGAGGAGGAGGHVVGWYHSHAFPDATLSLNDVDTHESCFAQPWQVALVLATRDRLLGGVFRRSVGVGWWREPLSFHEVPHPPPSADALPGERRMAARGWPNYRRPLPGTVAAPEAAAPMRLLFPDELEDAPPVPAGVGRSAPRRVARAAAFGLVGLLAVGGLLNVYEVVAARFSAHAFAGAADSLGPGAAGDVERVDRAADTLALAVAAFDVRAGLFERRQMGCAELARGLVEVEERWIAYNAARRSGVASDAARDARDHAAYADVTTAEQRFERSRCRRP
jgi:hypothetical protein